MKAKLYISAFIFIILTAIKLLAPGEAGKLRDIIVPEIVGGADLRTQILSLGSKLSGGETLRVSEDKGNRKVPVDAKSRPLDISEDFVLTDMVEKNLVGFVDVNIPQENTSLEKDSPPPDDEKIKKQTAFLEAQSEFSDYVIPAEVSYDIPVLAFEHCSPADAEVSSAFGYRIHPKYNDVRFHYGTDYALFEGEKIHAFANGTVASVQRFAGYGLTLIINHGNSCSTLYAHCSQILVEAGDPVSIGQTVALAGHSGQVTGPHLHFEVEVNGLRYNPELCF